MNWSKTKTILIIALLITNAIMLGYLYSERRLQDNTAITDRMVYQDVIKVLNERGIQVAFQEAPKIEGIEAVEAAYQTYDLSTIAPRFIGGEFKLNTEDTEASSGSESLRVKDGTTLIYENTGLPVSSVAPAEEEALAMARKFIAERGYPADENTVLSSVRITGKDIEVMFVQHVSHRQIENGVMRLVVTDHGIRTFERTWLRIIKVREMTYEIIPPGQALLKLSEQLGKPAGVKQAVTITAMTLGYKLDTDALNTNILSGDLSPYWRFSTRSGITYSVKALQ